MTELPSLTSCLMQGLTLSIDSFDSQQYVLYAFVEVEPVGDQRFHSNVVPRHSLPTCSVVEPIVARQGLVVATPTTQGV